MRVITRPPENSRFQPRDSAQDRRRFHAPRRKTMVRKNEDYFDVIFNGRMVHVC